MSLSSQSATRNALAVLSPLDHHQSNVVTISDFHQHIRYLAVSGVDLTVGVKVSYV